MTYTLYVGENCHQCQTVIDFLQREGVEYTKVNVDLDQEKPPIELFAFPALFLNQELIKYGTDIITYFNKKSHNN